MGQTHRRGPWSQIEDAELLRLVHGQGAHNWVRIANHLNTRSPKQCRERFHQNLKPSLNHEPISPEEGRLIEELVAHMGKRWAEIARRLHGRSDNAVKNWWNGGMNRRRRTVVREGDQSAHGPAATAEPFDEREPPLSFARPVQAPDRRPYLKPTLSSPPQRRPIDTPLPSPGFSEMSAETTTPSLVSDVSSMRSLSPRAENGNGRGVTLPPLIGTRNESRRPSLPLLYPGSGMFFPEADAHAGPFSPRFEAERRQLEGEGWRPSSSFRSPTDRSSTSKENVRPLSAGRPTQHAYSSYSPAETARPSLPSWNERTPLTPFRTQPTRSDQSLPLAKQTNQPFSTSTENTPPSVTIVAHQPRPVEPGPSSGPTQLPLPSFYSRSNSSRPEQQGEISSPQQRSQPDSRDRRMNLSTLLL